MSKMAELHIDVGNMLDEGYSPITIAARSEEHTSELQSH